MSLPIRLRRPVVRVALLGAAMLAVGLFLPAFSSASPDATVAEGQAARTEERARGSEERVTRAEERAARRAQEKATRSQEREARRAARAQERRARHSARQVSGSSPRDASSNGAPSESADSAAGDEPSASNQRPCHLAVAAASRITLGETVTVIGKLLCPSGVSAAEVPVTIYRHEPAKALALLGTATTAADGSFQLAPVAFDTNGILYFRTPQARNARTVVRVAPQVTLTATPQASVASDHSRPGVETRATFTGTVSPTDAGALVGLQIAYVASGGYWHPVAFGRVGSDGRYTISQAFRTPGEASIRTVVHASTLNMTAAISEPLLYEISQPQNPELTIETSADPIAYGKSVTIGGVATGAKSQQVTLLAHTPGKPFVVVASTTADATGHYTFTQEPLQKTLYRVTDATAQSTVLFESVGFTLEAAATPSTLQAGHQLTLSGTLAPAHAGQIVYLERQWPSGVGFHVVDTGMVDGASEYTIVHTFETAGTSVMRIKVPTDGERQVSFSAPFTVTVTP